MHAMIPSFVPTRMRALPHTYINTTHSHTHIRTCATIWPAVQAAPTPDAHIFDLGWAGPSACTLVNWGFVRGSAWWGPTVCAQVLGISSWAGAELGHDNDGCVHCQR